MLGGLGAVSGVVLVSFACARDALRAWSFGASQLGGCCVALCVVVVRGCVGGEHLWLLGVVWLAPLVRRRVFDFGVCFGVRLLGLVGFGSCSAHGITCSLAHAHALSLVCAIRSSSVGAAPWLLAGSQDVSAARLCFVFVCLCAWECGVV